jgi:hypothetical protein
MLRMVGSSLGCVWTSRRRLYKAEREGERALRYHRKRYSRKD